MQQWSGKTALITGVSSGIGAAIAERLLAEEMHVVGCARRVDRVSEVLLVADPAGNRSMAVECDVRDEQSVQAAFESARTRFGGVDVLINNAAIIRFEGGIDDSDQIWKKTWEETLAVNLMAPCSLMRKAVPHFRKKGGGIIITISSWVAHRGPGFPSMIAYASSKSAVMNATKTISKHYAEDNILAYIVAPGVVRTRMSENFAETLSGEEAITQSLVMKEWIPPSELGDLVTYLSGGTCRHLTGATLDVNGASYLR